MFTKLALVTHLALNNVTPGDRETLKLPFTALTVGESVPAVVLYAPIIACDALVIDKNTPLDVLTHCAVGRQGWLKF